MNVTFCGHSKINRTESFSQWLDMILPSFIEGGTATFYLGGYGAFDGLAAAALRKLKAAAIPELEQKVRAQMENRHDADRWAEIIRRYTEITDLDETILFELVDRIEVGEAKKCGKTRTGKLVCADCKGSLNSNAETQRRRNGTSKRYVSYYCSTYGKSGRSVCSWHRIYEQTLTQIVTAEIKAHAQAVMLDEDAVVEKLKRNITHYDEQRLADTQQEISRLRRRVQELEAMTAKLYEDKYNGAVSESTFMVLARKNEQERLAKAERLDALLSEVDKAQRETAAIHNWTAIIRKYLDLQELDRTIIDELIDRIEICERTVVDGQRRQDIKVYYRFVGLVE